MNDESFASRFIWRSVNVMGSIVGFAMLFLMVQIVLTQYDHPTLTLSRNTAQILIEACALVITHWKFVLIALVVVPTQIAFFTES